jgi:hypothetical protein
VAVLNGLVILYNYKDGNMHIISTRIILFLWSFIWFMYQNVSNSLELRNNTRRYEILHTPSQFSPLSNPFTVFSFTEPLHNFLFYWTPSQFSPLSNPFTVFSFTEPLHSFLFYWTPSQFFSLTEPLYICMY